VLNITASSQRKHAPPVLLNYLTTPHVTIASAVLASSAVPLLIHPVVLEEKGPDGLIRPYGSPEGRWRDGTRALPASACCLISAGSRTQARLRPTCQWRS
jgi:predicted acylesterase/phospholipase RssA